MKRRVGVVGTAVVWIVVLSGCERRDAEESETTETLPAKYKSQEPVPSPDFSDAAKTPSFRQAIRDASALLGAEPQGLESQVETGKIVGGVSFDVPQQKVNDLLRKAHATFLARGFYLFRYDPNYGIGGSPDKIALLPTADKYA